MTWVVKMKPFCMCWPIKHSSIYLCNPCICLFTLHQVSLHKIDTILRLHNFFFCIFDREWQGILYIDIYGRNIYIIYIYQTLYTNNPFTFFKFINSGFGIQIHIYKCTSIFLFNCSTVVSYLVDDCQILKIQE